MPIGMYLERRNMTRIIDYDVFCKVKAVAESGFYAQIYPEIYHDANKRLQLLQITEPNLYSEWLMRWKSHDRS